MNLPSPVGMGFVNVPVITPATAVQVPEPKRMGCTLIVISGAKTKSALRSSMCLSMPLVSWPSGQVTTVAFVEPVPLLVAEDVEVQGIEDLEVLLDGRRLLLVRRGLRRGVLRRRLREGNGGESGGCEAGQEIAMNRFHEWFLSREVRYAGTCSRWRRDHPAAGVPVGVELDERRVVRKAGSSPTGSRRW